MRKDGIIMSIASKQIFLKDIEAELGRILTAETLSKVMPAVSCVLGSFEVEQTSQGGAGSEDLLRAFIDAKQVEGRSRKTLERYAYVIRNLLEYTGAPTEQINVYHLRAYLMAEKGRGIVDRTLEGYRSVFSSYFGWLAKEGLIRSNPCANLGAIKCPKLVKEPYSDTDIERLKEACTSLRDRAIIAFLLSTGCRIGEVCALNRADIDFQAMECTVFGKGSKERVVYLDSVAAMMLRRYLDSRTDMSRALFIGQRGERLQAGGVRYMLKQLEEKTGVPNVHPHRFRRTLATNLISRGMPIQEVAAILGHDKLDTTMRYVFMDNNTIKNSYRKYA